MFRILLCPSSKSTDTASFQQFGKEKTHAKQSETLLPEIKYY